MAAVSSFFKKTIESTKFVRYIVEKYLLPFGFFDLSLIMHDTKLTIDPERIKSEVSYLVNEHFVTPMVSLSYDFSINIVFFMTPELFRDFENDVYLKNTALVQNKYNYSRVEKKMEENDTINTEVLFSTFEGRGIDIRSADALANVSLDFMLDLIPFSDIPDFNDTLKELVALFNISFDNAYIMTLMAQKKAELAKQEKLKNAREAVYQFLGDLKYARLSQALIQIQGEHNFPERTLKEVIHSNRQDIITCAITHIKKIKVNEYGKYRVVRVGDNLEYLLENSPFSYENIIRDDVLAKKLLKPMHEVSLRLKYDLNPLKLTPEYEQQVYVILKSRLALIIQDLLERNTILTSPSDFSSLLMFFTIMMDFKSQSSLHTGTSGQASGDRNLALGYKSFEELEEALYNIKNIIEVKFFIDLVNERLKFYDRAKNKRGLLYKIFAFFFLRGKINRLFQEKRKLEVKIKQFSASLKVQVR